MRPHHIVIVGGGFAGVGAALGAAAEIARRGARDRVAVTLIAPGDALVVTPRLYEADLGGTEVPLARLLEPVGVTHRRGAVVELDGERRRLTVTGPQPGTIAYDELVLAPGSARTGPPGLEHAHRIDTLAGARRLRRAVESLGGAARVTIVGGGWSGVELAAELTADARVTLVERAPQIAPGHGPRARGQIAGALTALGVTVRPDAEVAEIAADGTVVLAGGERVPADLAVVTTGPRAHPLTAQVGGPRDRLGRLVTDPMLRCGVDGVWVAGDSAYARVDAVHVAPMSCQHAGPQGRRAGANAAATAIGAPPRPYRQALYVACLDLGRAGALVTAGFAREDVIASGAAAKRLKRHINRSLIYPPTEGGAEALLAFGRSRAAGRLAGVGLRAALRSSALASRAFAGAPDRASALAEGSTGSP